MTVTLNLPPQVESEFIAAAQSGGVPVDQLLAEILVVSRTRNAVTGAAVVEAGGDLRTRTQRLNRSGSPSPTCEM